MFDLCFAWAVILVSQCSSIIIDITWSKSQQAIPTTTTAPSAGVYDNTLFIVDDEGGADSPAIHYISFKNLYQQKESESYWNSSSWSSNEYESIGVSTIRTECYSCYTFVDRYLYIVAPGGLYGVMLLYDMKRKEPVSIDDYNWNSTANAISVKWPCM